jgi:peptidoglycan/LPS O-acetylase OafA/YrhL
LFAAALSLVFGRKGVYMLPLLAGVVTLLRVFAGEPISIVTWYRVDEILAGASLVILYRKARLPKLPILPLLALFVVCSHPASGAMQYMRPYAAALLVGSTLITMPPLLNRFLTCRPMGYVAEISYALYVIHGLLAATWLGSGDRIEKYAKRPLLIGSTFLLAHLSTRYLEQPIMRAVRKSPKPNLVASAVD